MVSACCAYGCTYRHVTGNKIGLHRFPKDEALRQLWVVAIRRSNWKPTPSSRICGKHFQTGKPSKNRHHPDYVPNVFVFNQNRRRRGKRIAVENAEELLNQFSKTTSENENATDSDNDEEKKANEVSDNNEKSSIHPSKSPQCVWLFDFPSKENNLSISPKNETQNNSTCISLKNEMKLEISNSASNCDQEFIPTNEVDAYLQEDIDSIIANENYPSPLTDLSRTAFEDIDSVDDNAELCVTDDDSDSVQSFVNTNNDSNLTTKSSLPTIVLLNTESTTNKKSVNVERASETVKIDPLNSISLPIIKPIKEETTESDYSYFNSSPLDTKEILAIKLETMLAVNISLQEKVKFYRNRCKFYENEINNIASKLKNLKLMNSASFNN